MGKKYKNKKQSSVFSKLNLFGGNYALLPFLAVLLIVPLIVRIYYYDNPLSVFDWYPDGASDIDAFLYYKSILFSVLGLVMAVLAAYRLYHKKLYRTLKKDIWLYFLGAFGLLAFLSTLFSSYKSFGLHGLHEQFESVWVALSYCVVVLFAYLFLTTERDFTSVRRTLAAFLLMICALGLSQLFGHDFFETALGRYLIVPEELAGMRDHLTFNFSSSRNHQVYMTLYNPNYVGVFTALLLPAALLLTFSVKHIYSRILWGVLSVALLLCSMGSGSKSFMLALIPCILLGCVFLRRKLLSLWWILIPFVTLLVLSANLYFQYIELNPWTYLKNALSVEEKTYPCEDIRFEKDNVTIKYQGNTLSVKYMLAENQLLLLCFDESGAAVEYTADDKLFFRTQDSRFSRITFQFYNGTEDIPILVSANISGNPVYFTSTADGYRYVSSSVELAEPDYPATVPFLEKHLSFASGRGYIWSRSIPLLKDSLLLGSGADSFSCVYPQNDVVGKANGFYNNMIMTKPHCLYLQIGVQYGVPALLCFLVLCGIYLIGSCRVYWRCSFRTERECLGLGIALGVLGYLITGITNDSTVALAPLFWALLGVGFAVNRLNRRKEA